MNKAQGIFWVIVGWILFCIIITIINPLWGLYLIVGNLAFIIICCIVFIFIIIYSSLGDLC